MRRPSIVIKYKAMKKIIFILFLAIGASGVGHAQVLKILKTKAKEAVDNSVDRTTSKVVDNVINNPVDKATDTALDKAGKKVHGIFKKKNKKDQKTGNPEQPVAPATDSLVALPPDSTANKPQNQNR
jgi:hypothetical protein